MANLGYFQLKATPGAWRLTLREGRSSEIFTISDIKGAESTSTPTSPIVLVHDLTGTFLSLKMERKLGMENARLLDDSSSDSNSADNGLWSSLKSFVSPGSKTHSNGYVVKKECNK